MKKASLKPLWLILIILASILLLTVVLGALNATVGEGKWKIGWQSYLYSGADYHVGGSTVYEDVITGIDLDWIDGNVRVVLTEDDSYVSVTEVYEGAIAESAKLHWRVNEEGTLIVKARRSGVYWAAGMAEKDLILRIPSRYADALDQMNVTVDRGTISLERIQANAVTIEVEVADVLISNCDITDLNVQSKRGDLQVSLPENASFRMNAQLENGEVLSDFDLKRDGADYLFGDGKSRYSISLRRGDLRIKKA